MDNVYFAVAGVGMLVVGVLGIAGFGLMFLGALVRFALIPRLGPVARRFGTGVGSWVAPPPRREVALARADRPPR